MNDRAFLITDYGAIELPNHEPAFSNLDLTNRRLLVKRDAAQSVQIVSYPNGKSDESRPAAG